MWRPADEDRVLLMAGRTTRYAMEPRGEYVFGIVAGRPMRSRRGGERRLVRPGQLVAWDPSNAHAGAAVDARAVVGSAHGRRGRRPGGVRRSTRSPTSRRTSPFPNQSSPTPSLQQLPATACGARDPCHAARARRAARRMAARPGRALLGRPPAAIATEHARRPSAPPRLRLPRRPAPAQRRPRRARRRSRHRQVPPDPPLPRADRTAATRAPDRPPRPCCPPPARSRRDDRRDRRRHRLRRPKSPAPPLPAEPGTHSWRVSKALQRLSPGDGPSARRHEPRNCCRSRTRSDPRDRYLVPVAPETRQSLPEWPPEQSQHAPSRPESTRARHKGPPPRPPSRPIPRSVSTNSGSAGRARLLYETSSLPRPTAPSDDRQRWRSAGAESHGYEQPACRCCLPRMRALRAGRSGRDVEIEGECPCQRRVGEGLMTLATEAVATWRVEARQPRCDERPGQ